MSNNPTDNFDEDLHREYAHRYRAILLQMSTDFLLALLANPSTDIHNSNLPATCVRLADNLIDCVEHINIPSHALSDKPH